MRLMILLLMMIPFTVFAHGGTSIEDGGQGVLCEGFNSRLELLDLYEARTLYKFKPSLGAGGDTELTDGSMIDVVVAADTITSGLDIAERRLTEIEPTLPDDLKKAFDLARFYATSFHVSMIAQDLPLTSDSGIKADSLPRSCSLQQLAIFSPRPNLLPSLEVDENNWDDLEDVDRIALILHEGFHSAFADQPDTRAIRQLVAYLSAPKKFRRAHADQARKLVETRQALPQGFN